MKNLLNFADLVQQSDGVGQNLATLRCDPGIVESWSPWSQTLGPGCHHCCSRACNPNAAKQMDFEIAPQACEHESFHAF